MDYNAVAQTDVCTTRAAATVPSKRRVGGSNPSRDARLSRINSTAQASNVIPRLR
jgi:hypothetical protein